ncbi:MAG: AAA family ATPase [Frankiaceae bacterium]|nr:AAA family ATPase [Frankiaceae bacterium]
MGSTGTATVMFTDLVDSTGVRSRLGDDAADSLRRTHDSLLRGRVAAHGGTLVKWLGDGGMATFASASEAVAAAVATQQEVDLHNRRSPGQRLEVRIGLSAGDVLWEADDCFGRPVIEASRLCAEAAPAQVLASDVVRLLARSDDGAGFRSCGPKELKGLDRPVETHEVTWEPLAVIPVVSGQPELPQLLGGRGLLRFTGRDGQMTDAQQVWKQAVTGDRQALLLSGEPGIGKTRLAGEIALEAHRQGATVLYGRCEENLGAPYQPFAESLDHLLQSLPRDLLPDQLGRYPEELARLTPLVAERVQGLAPPLSSDAETERYRLFEAIASCLSAASTARGLVLVLDDLHWAARPTLTLLQHVLHATAGARLLLICTYRDTDLSRTHPLSALLADLRRSPGVTRVALGGLDRDGVAQLVAQAAGHDLDPDGESLATAVHAETEGNPFFVGEVLRHLRETRAIYVQDGRWVSDLTVAQIGIPEGIREVVGRRLDHLSADANTVLPVAAVIGRDFHLELLARVCDLPEDVVVTGLDEASRSRLLEETGVGCYRFSHALVRSTLYEELSATRRARVHARVASELERSAPDDAIALSHHYAEASVAGDLRKAAAYSHLAGDQAMEQLAHDQAVGYYAQALELVADAADVPPGTRAETLLALGEAQRRNGDPAFRETLLRAARLASETDDTERVVRAALANSRGFWSMAGQVDRERMAVLEEALARIGPADTADRARLLGRLASELMFTDDRPLRERLSDEAMTVARNSGDLTALADVLAEGGPANYTPWSVHRADAAMRELLELVPSLGDPYREAIAHLWSYIVAVFVGDDRAASDAQLEAAVRIGKDLGQPTVQWLTTFWRATQAQTEGRSTDALALAEQALAMGQASGQPDAWTWYAGQLTTVYREQGRLGDLVDAIEQEVTTHPGLPAWQIVFAQALCEVGRTDEARVIVHRFVDVPTRELHLPEDVLWIFSVAALADLCARLDETDALALLYDELLPFRHLTVHGGVAFYGSAEHHLGAAAAALHRENDAIEHLERAVGAHERLGARFFLGLSHAELAGLLSRRGAPGDAERASTSAQTARALAEETGGATILRALP